MTITNTQKDCITAMPIFFYPVPGFSAYIPAALTILTSDTLSMLATSMLISMSTGAAKRNRPKLGEFGTNSRLVKITKHQNQIFVTLAILRQSV